MFDLDPAPDVPFERVIAAALDLRRRLEDIGLVPFCKTTGGKGLHVVTPLSLDTEAGTGWPEAKRFAHDLCAVMTAAAPDRYLVNMSKKLRVGKIYLDYLRNDRLATAVAPLSPRARTGAPVSMPLVWSAVRAGLDPGGFTLRSVPALLKQSKAWVGYDTSRRSLRDAITALKDA